MKAYNFRLLGWLLIIGIFLDWMSTIIGVGYFGLREKNPIGFNIYLMISFIIIMLCVWLMIRYYEHIPDFKISFSRRKPYRFLIVMMRFAVTVRYLTIFSNIMMIISKVTT